MGNRRFRVQMLVDVDTTDVLGDEPEGIFCGTTLVPGFRVESVKTETE